MLWPSADLRTWQRRVECRETSRRSDWETEVRLHPPSNIHKQVVTIRLIRVLIEHHFEVNSSNVMQYKQEWQWHYAGLQKVFTAWYTAVPNWPLSTYRRDGWGSAPSTGGFSDVADEHEVSPSAPCLSGTRCLPDFGLLIYIDWRIRS